MYSQHKKILSILTAILMLICVLPFHAVSPKAAASVTGNELPGNGESFTPKAAIPGDYDGSGTVNVQDAILTLRAAMGLITPTEENFAAADIDGNN